ncbi:hypothetical protein [Paraglaciecola sp.]|uniref:hypothetical protein n=1 Tax=Paraglaciecola sp. TaxID=1920173 RepID=UPI003265FDB3
MNSQNIEELYLQSKIIVEHFHQFNVQRFESGKSKVLSDSAMEFKSIIEETYGNKDFRGIKHLRKDLNQMISSLPKDSKNELKKKLDLLQQGELSGSD